MEPMTRLPPRTATYDDLLALPEHVVGEIVDGELHVSPRPAPVHSVAASAIGEELGPPFDRGRGGPGGWIILDEPELHLGEDVLVPDLAGWRRARTPSLPDDVGIATPPDWVCEVLSPSTERLDRRRKLAVYARNRVSHVWFVDALAQTLEVLRLDGDTYRIVLSAAGAERIRAEPFDAIELDLAILWAR
jgi:Uma2 family endonuclease